MRTHIPDKMMPARGSGNPMVPGAFTAKGIFGLYALTAPNPADPQTTAATAMEFTLRVLFTLIMIGPGLSITAVASKSLDYEAHPDDCGPISTRLADCVQSKREKIWETLRLPQ